MATAESTTASSTTVEALRASDVPPARSVHRIAVLVVCLVWPLIWVGGLVTTYDAGMSVPDWPGTYGYNLLLYPYKTWLLGPFDLFIEHGHRLLGAVVGFVSIGLLLAAFRSDPRRWVTALAAAVLLAVIAQGILGGVRVVLSDRTVAMLHGCGAPLVLALSVTAAVATSRWWWRQGAPTGVGSEHHKLEKNVGRGAISLVAALTGLSYVQLVLGAMLRHVQPTTSPGGFAHTVAMHVLIAVLLWILSVVVWLRLRRCGDLTLSRPGGALIGLVGVQILLGISTWVVNYGFPVFLQFVPRSAGFVVQAQGFADSIIVTGHVATGSLILAVSTMVLLRSVRLRHVGRGMGLVPAGR